MVELCHRGQSFIPVVTSIVSLTDLCNTTDRGYGSGGSLGHQTLRLPPLQNYQNWERRQV